MILALWNHLWQSTLCAGVVAMLIPLLRRNGAHIRYWLWFGASAKFFVPFAFLLSLGRALAPEPSAAHGAIRALPLVINGQGLSIPLKEAVPVLSGLLISWQEIALVVWASGALAVAVCWSVRWWRLRALIREARPLAIAAPVPVLAAHSMMEPGLFGIVRPVLLLPEGLAEQLSVEETQSILAHELCHLRRRDNLTYSVHLLCQAVFWFFPPAWWLGRRLIIERERACDDIVLASGHDPRVYSESILKVCRHYIGAPVVCNAGVSGRDSIYRRVQHIMYGHRTIPLGLARRLLVVLVAVAIVTVPIVYGLLDAPVASAQAALASTSADIARRLYEQTRPRREITIDPKSFDRYVGYYEIGPMSYLHVYRIGDRFFAQPTGQPPVEQFPESPTKFFATVVAAQLSFVTDRDGQVTEVVLQQNGLVQPAVKVAAGVATQAQAALQERIKSNVPSAGTEASVRRWIQSEERGQPDYGDMSPALAATARLQTPVLQVIFSKLDAFRSLAFKGVNSVGWDVYEATFAHGQAEILIAPLTADGKVYGLYVSAPTAVSWNARDNASARGSRQPRETTGCTSCRW